jgi:hypothetical protein
VEDEFIDAVVGIPGSRTEIVVLRPPDGGAGIEPRELRQARSRVRVAPRMADELGLRSICFEVNDVQVAVDRLAANVYGLVGGIGQHQNTGRWPMCAGRRESSPR